MKRLLLFFLCLCMMAPMLALMPFEVAAAEPEVKFTLEKTTFVYGEPILVTPLVGSGKDEIAIAPTDSISGGAMRYKRIEEGSQDGTRVASKGMGIGVAVDIRTGAIPGNRDAEADIKPGNWTVLWIPDGGAASTATYSVDIVVTDGPISTDKLEYRVGEAINVTATMAGASTKTWYGIVPDEGGAPKYSYGTILYHDLYKALPGDGTMTTTHNLRDYTATGSGKMSNASLVTQCAAFMGVAERGMFSLPAGTYWIVYCADSSGVESGNAVTHKIQIKIKPAIELEKTTFASGEAINVTAYGRSTGDEVFITPKLATLESDIVSSIRWKAFTSGVKFDMKTASATSYYPELLDLPAGEYSLFIIFKDEVDSMKAKNANYATRVDITVSGTKPVAPASVSYVPDSTTNGLAAGDMTVTFTQAMLDDKNAAPTHVVLYWGDENGKLADQTYLTVRRVNGNTTVNVDLSAVTMIPANATRLMAYAYNACGVSDDFAYVDLPAHTDTFERGEPITSFQIVSDVHSNTDANKNQHIRNFFADVKAIDPNSAGIFVSGDITNNGTAAEYDNLYTLWNEYFGTESDVHIPFYAATGNHEYKPYGGDDVFDEKTALFIENVNKYLSAAGQEPVDKHYYDLWIDGFHFIFIGGGYAGTNAYINDEQLAWLDATLAEDRKEGRPSFVMLHQCLYNTVAGGMPGQTWNGVIAGDENWEAWKALKATSGSINDRNMLDAYEQPLRDILRKYPEAMMFSGHSHWEMTTADNMYDPDNVTDPNNALPNYLFNTGAVAYLASGVRKDTSEDLPYNTYGGHGYYVYIYENCIEFHARNYKTQQWVPNATYRIAFDTPLCAHTYDNACDDACNECGATRTVGEHVYDNACDVDCNECGATRIVGEHQYDGVCDVACNECGATREVTVEHNYEHDCDAVCGVCGETREAAHVGEYGCSDTCRYCDESIEPEVSHAGLFLCSDACATCHTAITPAAQHESAHICSTICKYCQQDVLSADSPHTYDNACDAACNECHAIREVDDHVGLYECSDTCRHCGVSITPEKAHERKYTCNTICKYCNEKIDTIVAANGHFYSNVCDVDCNVCGDVREVGAHVGEYDCSTVCKHCDAEIEAVDQHTSDHACATVCKYCHEAVLTPDLAHGYDNDCDADCNACGETRTELSHTYDNACDTDCEYCDETREVGDHEGLYDCSAVCKHCGADKTPASAHTSLHDCSEICRFCGEAVATPSASHQGAVECSDVCATCGATITPDKSHEGEYVCTDICRFCNQTVVTPTKPHAGYPLCSDSCSTCGTPITPEEPHKAAHDCSNVCKYCEQECVTPTAPHAGEHECSDICAACGADVPHIAHEGAYACSDVCRYCGMPVAAETSHEGENPCSDTCATCGKTIAAGSHEGAHACSQTCKHCGAALEGVAEHSWDSGAVTTQPTVEAEGERTYTCTVCGTKKTEAVEKLPTPSGSGDGNTVTDGSSGGSNADGGAQDTATAETGLPAGAIVAIVLGAVALLGVGGICLWRFVLRKKK